MSDSLYKLRCPNRDYLAQCTVILIRSHDCNHITWFRNSASVSLFATFSHRTWVASDFSSSQLFQNRSKISDCTFWKFSYKRKFFFLTHLLYAKSTFNSDRKLYKKRWCDQMRIWFNFHWKNLIHYLILIDDCREEEKKKTLINCHKLLSRDIDKLSQIAVAKTLCWKR
jgi:hypothetical protein